MIVIWCLYIRSMYRHHNKWHIQFCAHCSLYFHRCMSCSCAADQPSPHRGSKSTYFCFHVSDNNNNNLKNNPITYGRTMEVCVCLYLSFVEGKSFGLIAQAGKNNSNKQNIKQPSERLWKQWRFFFKSYFKTCCFSHQCEWQILMDFKENRIRPLGCTKESMWVKRTCDGRCFWNA